MEVIKGTCMLLRDQPILDVVLSGIECFWCQNQGGAGDTVQLVEGFQSCMESWVQSSAMKGDTHF